MVVDDQMEIAASELRGAVNSLPVPKPPARRKNTRISPGGLTLIAAAFSAVLLIGIPGLLFGPTRETSPLANPPSLVTDSPGMSEPVAADSSELPALLGSLVQNLGGFPSDATSVQLVDAGEDGELMLIASYTTDDGGLIDVVVQRLNGPIPIDVIDPSGSAETSTGPDGESIIFVDKRHTIQLMARNEDGLNVNLIVERINRVDPDAPSTLTRITKNTLTEWALSLLDALSEQF